MNTNFCFLKELYKRGVRKAKNFFVYSEYISDLDFESLEISRVNVEECYLELVNFTNCYFNGVEFSSAEFKNVTFSNCRFEDCYFFESTLKNMTFSDSILEKTHFIASTLDSIIFSQVILECCYIDKVEGSNLELENCSMNYNAGYESNIYFSKITNCSFSNFHHDDLVFNRCEFFENIFANTDISFLSTGKNTFIGIQRVDYLSVVKTVNEPDLPIILSKCGIPTLSSTYMIDSIKALDTNIIMKLMQSVFISYGGTDHFFASILNLALKKDGINTYFFPDNSIPGQKLHRVMRSELRKYDRVIFICSESSLLRVGVLNELENVLSKEAELGGEEILIPITLDDYIFEKWKPKNSDHAISIRERVVTKFDGSFAETNEKMETLRYKNALINKMRKTSSYKKVLTALTSQIISSLE